MRLWNMADQVHRGFGLSGQFGRRPVSHYMHKEHVRLVKEEVVVKRRHLDSVIEERRHDWVDFVLEQHHISDHDVFTAVALCHGQPATEAEGRGGGHTIHGDLHIVSRDVDLEDIRFVVPLLAERLQYLLVFDRHLLSFGRNGQSQGRKRRYHRTSCRELPFHFSFLLLFLAKSLHWLETVKSSNAMTLSALVHSPIFPVV